MFYPSNFETRQDYESHVEFLSGQRCLMCAQDLPITLPENIKNIYLGNLFDKLGIDDFHSFQRLIRDAPKPFKHITLEDLPIGSDRAIYSDTIPKDDDNFTLSDEELRVEGVIFNLDDIYFKDFKNVIFFNCIFTGSVRVAASSARLSACFVRGSTLLMLKEHGSLDDVRSEKIELRNAQSLSISCVLSGHLWISSPSDILEISDTQTGSFLVSEDIKKLSFKNFAFKEVNESTKNQQHFTSLEPFRYPKKPHKNARLDAQEKTRNLLLRNPDADLSEWQRSELTYQKKKSRASNKWERLTVILTGGFVRPWIWLFHLLMSLAVGTVSLSLTIQDTSRSIVDFLTIAGFSLSTLGFSGDLVPTNDQSRWICISLAFYGIFITGGFLVSFANRYIRH